MAARATTRIPPELDALPILEWLCDRVRDPLDDIDETHRAYEVAIRYALKKRGVRSPAYAAIWAHIQNFEPAMFPNGLHQDCVGADLISAIVCAGSSDR